MSSIDPLRHNQQLNSTKTQSKTQTNSSSNNASVSPNVAREDAFSMSEQGKALRKMNNELAKEPSFDAERVKAIKEAIANGSYKVDPQQLAENMLKHEQFLKDFT